MQHPFRFIYISSGNFPAKDADSVQIIKMAEAFSAMLDDFRFVIANPVGERPVTDDEIHAWYGLHESFPMIRMPVKFRTDNDNVYLRSQNRYTFASAVYAKFKHAGLVYTRLPRVAYICMKLGLKTIWESHAVDTPRFRLAFRHVYRNPRLLGMVTVHPDLKRRYVNLGYPEEHILVWPNGINPADYADLPAAESWRRAHRVPIDKTVIMYSGNFALSRGVTDFIDAARLLPHLHFCLVGGRPHEIEEMKRHADGLSNVQFLGFVSGDAVPKFLASADILILPNSARFDHANVTSPMKMFEYMAARRPIVATDIPANHGFLRHDDNCHIVEPDSPKELAEGIKAVSNDSALAEALTDTAWSEVQRYTWKARARDILDFFDIPRSTAP